MCTPLKTGIYSAAESKSPGREQNAQQIGVNRLAASILNAHRLIVWRQTPARYNWPLIRVQQKVNSSPVPLIPPPRTPSQPRAILPRPFDVSFVPSFTHFPPFFILLRVLRLLVPLPCASAPLNTAPWRFTFACAQWRNRRFPETRKWKPK